MNLNYFMPRWALFYVAAATCLAGFTFYCLVLGYHMGPFRDMWIVMDFLRHGFGAENLLNGLFSLHGGAHRLVIPRMLYLIEYGVFGGTNTFLIGTGVLVQLSLVGLVWRLTVGAVMRHRVFLASLTLLLMINPLQLENFLYTFDIQWFLTAVAAVWALTCWILFLQSEQNNEHSRTFFFMGGLFFTFVSVFSSFSGICLLLILPLLAWGYQRSWLNAVIVLAVVGSIIFIYLQGPFSTASHWIGIKDETVTVGIVFKFTYLLLGLWLKWIVLYLGSPLSREFYVLAFIMVVSSLCYISFYLYRLIRFGKECFTWLQLLFLFAALFAALVGLATGWGRMYFINTANEDRYQSIVAIYWLGLFGFAYLRSISSGFAWYSGIVLMVILFWTCLVVPYFSLKDAKAQINFFDKVNTANLAIATGQWEFQAIKSTLILGDKIKQINRPEMQAGFLREKGWGVFNMPQTKLLNTVLPEVQRVVNGCEGAIGEIAAVGGKYGGYRLEGSAWDVQADIPVKQLLVTDKDYRIIGLARLQRQKDSLLPISWQHPDQARWAGYTVDIGQPTFIVVWGLRADGLYCPVAQTTLASAKLPIRKS